MANAYKSLRTGLKADIEMMVEGNFVNVDASIIQDAYLCVHIMKIGKNSVGPTAWLKAWHLYGLSSYARITAHLEKELNPRQRNKLNLLRSKTLYDKKDFLKKYVALPPYLAKKMGLKSDSNLIAKTDRAFS